MAYLLLSFMFFCASVVCHVLWCRLRRIKTIAVGSFCAIGLVFFVAYMCFLALWSGPGDNSGFFGEPFKITSAVFYLSMIPFYVVFYHMVVVNSPTRLMLELGRKKGRCSYEELADAVVREDFIKSRLEALLQDRIVVQEETVYRLSRQGALMARGLEFYQALVGRPKGG